MNLSVGRNENYRVHRLTMNSSVAVTQWQLATFIVRLARKFPRHNRALIAWALNPLHANIRIHILHTVLFIFPIAIVRRIFVRIGCSPNKWSCLLFSLPFHLIQKWYCKEKLDISHGFVGHLNIPWANSVWFQWFACLFLFDYLFSCLLVCFCQE